MKILYDYQAFQLQKFGGISRYFYEIIKHLQTNNFIHCELSISYSDNEYLRQLPVYKDRLKSMSIAKNEAFLRSFGGRQFKGKRRLYKIKNKLFPKSAVPAHAYLQYNKLLTIKALEKGDFDIFHPTFYDDYFLEYIGNKPYILTVYDLIHQIFPEFYLEKLSYADKSRELIERANHIIAISEHTKKDLMTIYQVPSNKITVTHLGNSLDGTLNILHDKLAVKLPERYLLYVGNRVQYKNFYFFMQAIRTLLIEDESLFVVCTGGIFSKAEKEYLYKLGLENKIVSIYATDPELALLYKNAIAFVFPSLYEGFGLPVLEAFSCGCPIAVSNSSSLPEVGGQAAEYFDPKNADSIKNAVAKLVYNPQVRQLKIEAGYHQLQKFSWQQTVNHTIDVYKKIEGYGN